MQKWSCSRCGRIMTQITNCENCGTEEVYDLVSSVEVDDFHDQAMTSRVTEVLDSSQFTRDKSEDESDIDEQISESAIACKEEEMAFFDSQASAKGDIFEETSLEDSVDATMVLGTKPSKEPSAPTVFIPTDSEIRQAFGEQPINATDETFVHPQIPHSQLGGFPKDTQPKSLPHVGGSALASTREQEEGPSRFQRSDVIGGIFGRCRVAEKISEGAMGRVYKAYHQTLDKTVVLKELPPSLASSQELRERFIREAKACAKIHHQNVVQVLDAGYENGIYFYIMEYVDGFTVEEMLTQKKKLSVERACNIIIDAAKGLHTAHQQGVVHRDIKASNIMVTRQGQVKVADFGLACDLGSSKISVAGQIMGTPQYMSPEQWDGATNVDARSDLYSLGITFYYMLADRLPFDSGSTVTLFKQHISEKPPALKALNPDIPPALIKIVNKLMHKDREKRYYDAQELVEDLESFLRDNHKRSAVRRKVVMLSVVMAFVAGIAYAHNLGYTKKVLRYIQTAMKTEISNPDKDNTVDNEKTQQVTPENKNSEQQVENNQQGTEQSGNSQQDAEQTGNSEQEIEKAQGVPHETTQIEKENTKEHTADSTSQQENGEQKNNGEQQTENTPTNIKKETSNEEPSDHVQDTGEKSPQKIEVVLPRIQVKMKKRIFNNSDVAVYGKISGKLLPDMKIFLLVQKNNRLHKKQSVLIKGNKFFAKMRLSDGKYKVVPQVMHVKEHKKRIGRVLSFVIDSQPPTVTVLSPGREQVFYEEQVGNSVAIKVEIRDFLKIATAFVYQQNRKIPLRSQGNHYAGNVTLQYGKQSLYVVAYDQARNMQKIRCEWALVPRNMVRIPGGTITVNGQVVNFKTFYINKSEVTNAQYAQYLQKSGAQHPLRWQPQNTNAWRNKPVVFVSYEEAVRYCQFQKKRLPSEAEWVAAALWDQNKLRKYPWGESGDVAWPRKIKEVTSWSVDTSHFGIHDMAGNVSEWVQNSDQDKAMRKGGNFILNPRYLKRMLWDQVNFMEPKSSRKNWLGFRCAFSEQGGCKMQYLLLLVVGFFVGCQYAPVTTTPLRVIPKEAGAKMNNTITVGVFIDNRFSFWPRKEQNSPLVTQDDSKMMKDFEPIPGMKEVRIPMGDVRSRLSSTLKDSGQFKEIINPPTRLIGDSLEKMLEKSLETSDYLIVGEVNRFHIRDLGRNTTSALTIPFDMTLLFLPNLIVFPLSQGKSFLLTGNAFRTRTAECVLSMSVTIYEVESGNPVTTFRLEENAMAPVDATAVYGDFYNDEDDWVDISRKLGEVALANASVAAIAKVRQAIAKK